MAESDKVLSPGGGSNQARVRAYNERLVMSLVRKHGHLPKVDIARYTGLSAQTISVIMRALEADKLLIRGKPQRGKVGQPSIPMSLNPEGAYAIGLKIGRRSADVFLVDFLGREQQRLRTRYAYPVATAVLEIAEGSIKQLLASLDSEQLQRVAGIGVAMPFALWNWAEKIGAPQQHMADWQTLDFQQALQERCTYPVFLQNDATAACGAELVFGKGSELTDFIYFFIGTFIGGGIVLNQAVYSGRTGNAGALGSMPVIGEGNQATQLIDHTSLMTLEETLHAVAPQGQTADNQPITDNGSLADVSDEQWVYIPPDILDNWLENAAKHLAMAIISSCSVIDFEAALIDGDLPHAVKHRLVNATRAAIATLDTQGIKIPEVLAGQVGRDARTLGAASLPLFARYLLDKNVLFSHDHS